MLLGTLGVSLLGNLWTGRGIYRLGKGKGVLRAGYGCPSSSASQNNSKMDFLYRPTL